MMKTRRYILWVMAAVLMAACGNDADEAANGYVPSTEPIAFDASTDDGQTTRAPGETNDDAALQAKGFGVFASYTRNVKYENTNVSPDFMYNQQVTYDAGAWKYAPTKYWPNNVNDDDSFREYVTFFAYAPYEADPDAMKCIAAFSAEYDLGDPWLVYRIAQKPWGDYNTTTKIYENPQQADLLYGVNAAGGNKPWYDQQKPENTSKIKFTFLHALSCIGDVITIKMNDALNTRLSGYATITINKVEISYTNLTSKARLMLSSDAAPNWKPIVSGDVTTTRTLTIEPATAVTLSTEAQEISTGQGLFYIPLQVDVNPQRADITVYYTVNVTAGSSYNSTATGTFNLSTDADQIGKKQAIALTIDKNLDLAHLVYDLTDDPATGPSYIRKR